VSNVKNAGNPTFARDRSNEKVFPDVEGARARLGKELEELHRSFKVKPVAERAAAPEL